MQLYAPVYESTHTPPITKGSPHTDAFMLPDVVADEDEFNAVVNEWFQELETEDPITRPVG